MSIDTELEAEEQELDELLNSGVIDMKQYNKKMHDLQTDCRAMAEDSAQEAYDDEMSNW